MKKTAQDGAAQNGVVPPAAEEQASVPVAPIPHEGGSYTRLPDGTLQRNKEA